MVKISVRFVFQVLEYTILIGLTIASLLLSWEAIVKYESKDTNLKVRQEEVKSYPTITLCLKPVHDELVYGQDFNFNIYKHPQEFREDVEHTLNILQEGENNQFNLRVTKIVTAFNGKCFKISPMKNEIEISDVMVLSVKFDKPIQNFLSQSVEIFVTSEANAFGIFRAYWFEGELFKAEAFPKEVKLFGFTEYETNYLEGTNGCSSNQSWYDCYTSMAENLKFEDCPSKCLAHSIRRGNEKLAYCKPKSLEWECSNRHLKNVRISIISNKTCPRLCKIIQYTGTEMETISKYQHPNTIAFGYYYMPPYVTYVYDEFHIFDFLGLLSSVGGLLGVFIGFSILGVVSKCFFHLISCFENEQ